MSLLLNALICAVTFFLTARFFFRDGHWCAGNARKAFRFFTVQSNVFCAAAALGICLFPASNLAWILKYIGTAAVTVTMLTVFLFLAPSAGSLAPLLKGGDLFMHLITPIMALLSFCVYEKQPMTYGTALMGMLPVVLYGTWYLYKVQYAPRDRQWEDFYGFNRGGRWPVAFTGMMLGSLLICTALFVLQNL